MAKYNAPVKQEQKSSIPDYPDLCMNSGCQSVENKETKEKEVGKTDIALVVARNALGKKVVNTFSEVGYRDKDGLKMKNGYTFVRWVTRCARCHYSDLLVTNNVYFKNKWTERIAAGEVKDKNLSIEQAKHFMGTFGK